MSLNNEDTSNSSVGKKERKEERIFDELNLKLKAGKGGNGTISFRKEKYIEYGGPNGGNGGRGGSIVIQADKSLNTLVEYRYKRNFTAENGKAGGSYNKTGHSGKDLNLRVPVGTEIIDCESLETLQDFTADGQQVIIAYGGQGGMGNANFKSSVNRAPRKATPGDLGEEREVTLRLKIISDIGIIGFPNSGKSSFLATVTRAKPKIANYAFTTLSPNLGVIWDEYEEIILADIPGLVENASKGYGLGDYFLKHIERCRGLVHLISSESDDILRDYEIIRNELAEYDDMHDFDQLKSKNEIVAISKSDITEPDEIEEKKSILEKETGKKVFVFSSFSQEGLSELKDEICKVFREIEDGELYLEK